MIAGIRNNWDGSYLTPGGGWTEDMGSILIFDSHVPLDDAKAKAAELMAADENLDCSAVLLEECEHCGDLYDFEAGYIKNIPATRDDPGDELHYCQHCGDSMASAEDRYWESRMSHARGE